MSCQIPVWKKFSIAPQETLTLWLFNYTDEKKLRSRFTVQVIWRQILKVCYIFNKVVWFLSWPINISVANFVILPISKNMVYYIYGGILYIKLGIRHGNIKLSLMFIVNM